MGLGGRFGRHFGGRKPPKMIMGSQRTPMWGTLMREIR